MYFVHYRAGIMGYNLCKFNSLEDAREFVTNLTAKGFMEVYVSQEIPVKVKVEVNF